MVEMTLHHLAKKLLGEGGEATDKQRVIHELAANGLEANPYVINEKTQYYEKMAIRSDGVRNKGAVKSVFDS